MPAEWEPHAATWLSWPRREGISFPGAFDRVMPTFRAMVAALIESEPVCINVSNGAHEAEARAVLDGLDANRITYFEIPTNECWCRDHGPIFLTRGEQWSRPAPGPESGIASRNGREGAPLAIIDWGHNAWGGKYPPFDLDDAVPQHVAAALDVPLFDGGMILEGGSIDVNGAGALLTTEACLLNPNRNPQLDRAQIEQCLRDFLGVRDILWLGDGIEGDDTDGHVDDLTRFVSQRAVVTIVEERRDSANYAPLQENLARLQKMKIDGAPLEIYTLPTPARIEREDLVLPASYANFYIANTSVLLPTFADPMDEKAIATLTKLFPTRRIVPIDCRELIWGLGAFHCLTQQQPALADAI
ncbi:MAG: agmatine deiminase family protein [Verrucomicrobiota bacterium]|nr:agmatine deiminase family protein [Verrucomicrobiota bacterium]